MPIVPTYERQKDITSGPTGPMADAGSFGAAVGRGLQQAGAGLQSLAFDLNAMSAEQKAEYDRAAAAKEKDDVERATFFAQTEMQRLRTTGEQLMLRHEQEAPPHASDFSRGFMDKFTSEAEKIRLRIDPRLQDRFAPQLEGMRGEFSTRALKWELDRKNTWYRDEVKKAAEGGLVQVDADPTRFDATTKQMFGMIDDTGLSAWEKDELKLDFMSRSAEAAGMKSAEARARADAINGVPLGTVARPAASAGGGVSGSAGGGPSGLRTGGANPAELSEPAQRMLQGIQQAGVVPILSLSSGRRSQEGNRKAGGAKGSQHLHGNAVDISLAGMTDDEKAAVLEAAIANGARGVGIYKSGRSLHVDTRQTPTLWGSGDGDAYAGHGVEKAPAWAQPVLTKLMAGEPVTVTRRGGAAGGGSATDAFVEQVVGVESGGKATARNPNSSATDAGQFIEATWLEMMRKHRPDDAARLSEAEQLALRNDPTIARQMVRAYAEENGARLRDYGIEATPGTLYLAHFLGPDTAAGVLKADPDAPVADLVGAKAVAANASVLRGKTAGEVVAWANGKMGGAGVAMAAGGADAGTGEYRSPVADIVDDPRFEGVLTLKQREAIEKRYGEAYREQKQLAKTEDAEAKFRTEQAIQADLASLAATGTPVDGLDVATVEGVLGADKAAAWQRSRSTARQTFRATRDLGVLDDDALSQRIEDTEPTPGALDFDEQAAVHKAVRDGVEQQRKLRANDPAAAVDAIPQVAAARAAMRRDNPDSVRALVEARLSAQTAIGIPDALRSPLTEAEARRLGASLAAAELRTAKGTITELVEDVRSTFGDRVDLVFRQVVREVVKDDDIAQLAARMMTKLATGKPPTVSEAATFDTVQEAALANQATAGTLPPPPFGPPADDPRWQAKGHEARGSGGGQGYITPLGSDRAEAKTEPRDPIADSMAYLAAHPRYWTIRTAHEKALKANPAAAEQFDRVYGAGAAASVLSGQADVDRAAEAKARADQWRTETGEGE
jgi:hypothetical protein